MVVCIYVSTHLSASIGRNGSLEMGRAGGKGTDERDAINQNKKSPY